MTAPTQKFVFVYGTLKRGGTNHHLLVGQRFAAEARTLPGYTLYELDGYPGMVADAHDCHGVTGEIWEVDPYCLKALDDLEGTAEGLYRREPVPLAAPYDRITAEAYVYARSLTGRRPIGASWPV